MSVEIKSDLNKEKSKDFFYLPSIILSGIGLGLILGGMWFYVTATIDEFKYSEAVIFAPTLGVFLLCISTLIWSIARRE